jgi:hypothetical protein
MMITAYGDEATMKRVAELRAAGLLTNPIDFRAVARRNRGAAAAGGLGIQT